jgi:multiple sugar transport system substrate-binding protein
MKRYLGVVCGAVLLLSACADSQTPASNDDGEPTSITVQVSGEREETAVYRAMVTAYENDHPDAQVKLVEVADKGDHLTKLATSFAAGDPPDVFLVNFREYSQFVSRGAIAPYGDHVEDLDVDLDAYYPAPLEAFTFNGDLQCMPQNVSSLVVYYNLDLFDQAGVEPPAAGWTWEDFRAAGEALTKGDVRGIGLEANIIRVAPFVWSNGGEIVNDETAPTEFTLDTPEAREALEFITGLVKDGLVPTEQELSAQDLETRFVTNKLGMLLSSRRDTPAFREVRGLNWDVGPLPVAEEQVGILHSDGYCISEGSNEEAAADFIAYATGNQGQTIAALGGRTVPSMISISESGAFLDPSQPPESSQVFLDAIPNLRRTPVLPTWTEIEDLSEEILTRLFYEPGYTIDDAIDALESETLELFEEGVASLN